MRLCLKKKERKENYKNIFGSRRQEVVRILLASGDIVKHNTSVGMAVGRGQNARLSWGSLGHNKEGWWVVCVSFSFQYSNPQSRTDQGK
jgi:hypothetical protein